MTDALAWAASVTGRRVTGSARLAAGPAWLDVAHGASNLARRHGTGTAARFAAAYVAETGRDPEPFWDVMDVVGFLPPPGGRMWFDGEGRLRLEEHLARVVERLG